MIYVKVENGNVTKYPYTFNDLRRDNPETVFPIKPSAESLVDFNTYIVKVSPKPEVDYLTQTANDSVVFQNDEWSQVWTIENVLQEEAEKNIRRHRDYLLSETDWRALSDVTLSPEWADYRQLLREVPQQAGFPYEVEWPDKPA